MPTRRVKNKITTGIRLLPANDMKNFLAGFFGSRPPATDSPASSQLDNRDSRDPEGNPLTIADGSDNATRRQLVQLLMRDALRKSGIPSEWLECQMLLVDSRSRGQGMYIRLIIKHWDERLLRYAFAFQQTLMTDIRRFEPNAQVWLHGISWQLDVEGQCPYAALPEPSFWREQVQAPAIPEVLDQPAPAAASDEEERNRARDLERLFAIRDKELERDGSDAVGYEQTQPAPLYEATVPARL